ncbi:MAG: hypothetical protein GWO02_10740, partial [Gammaproteobacteria bacterium]|nr:hypothetical protein [Gammaproteobacteria bacterium]
LLGAGERLLEQRDYEVVIPRARGVDPQLFESALREVSGGLRDRFHVVDDGYHALLPHLRVAA